MSAEQLIALEAAMTELSTLYAVARNFAMLRAAAEGELLPQLLALGSALRRHLRVADLSDNHVDEAARKILALRASWRAHLEQVRALAVYQEARQALASDRQTALERLLPQVFAGLEAIRPAPTVFFPISPSSAQRRPGSSPFLSAAECAQRIVQTLTSGLQAEESGSEWWERDWPCIVCAGDPGALDSPITLRLEGANVRVTVFAAVDDPTFRIFTPRLHAPMAVVLAADATDEWWQAYEDSYQVFRRALERELAAHAVCVDVTSQRVSG